jgi:hypothetical protein
MAWGFWALGLTGCAGDVTTLDTRAAADPAPPVSQTLELLGEPDTVDVSCNLIGLAARNLMQGRAGGADPCAAVVDNCQSALGPLEGGSGGAGDLPLPDGDLQSLLGCPLTFTELDACVADILTSARDSYSGTLSCSAESAPPLDTLALAATPACFIAALRCPELLAALGNGNRRQ